jgi:hypothetical protein
MVGNAPDHILFRRRDLPDIYFSLRFHSQSILGREMKILHLVTVWCIVLLADCSLAGKIASLQPATSLAQPSSSALVLGAANRSVPSGAGNNSYIVLKDGMWNVPCGPSGFCSETTPICCGSSYPFCIGGGQRCCVGLFPADVPNGIASCGLDQECCVGGSSVDFAVNCCNKTQSCQNGMCVPDICSNTSSADYCLSHPMCEWCCVSRRCQRKYSGASCIDMIRRHPSDTCHDNCTYQATCGTCVAAKDRHGRQCSWCAQTQSCLGADALVEICTNNQWATNPSQCESVGPTGNGLSHVSSATANFGPIILAVLAGAVILVLFLTAIRVCLYRRRVRNFMRMLETAGDGQTNNPYSAAMARGHNAVLKFGFKTPKPKGAAKSKSDGAPAEGAREEDTATEASQLEMADSPRGPTDNGGDGESEIAPSSRNRPQAVVLLAPNRLHCPVHGCSSIVHLPNPSHEPPPAVPAVSPSETTDRPESEEKRDEENDAAQDRAKEIAEDNKLLCEEPVEEIQSPSSPNQEEEPETAHSIPRDHPSQDKKLVVLLPCYHFCCVLCARKALGRTEKEGQSPTVSGTEGKTQEGEQTEASSASSAPPPGSKPDAEISRCPHCHVEIECIFVPSKIIHN